MTYSLGEGTALADGDPVTFLNTESGRDVSGKVLVSLLVTVVLGDVVEVFTADDDGTVHLGGDDTAGQDTATDGNQTGEGALLVCSISVILSHLGFEQHDWTSPEPLRDENNRVPQICRQALFPGVISDSFSCRISSRSFAWCSCILS